MADRFDEMARAHLGCAYDPVCDAVCKDEQSRLAALLRKVRDEARAEADRLRKLFDDAGQGEHNVLALVDHYQRSSMEADERLLAARKVVEAARHAYDCLARHCMTGAPIECCGAMTHDLGDALADYDKAVRG